MVGQARGAWGDFNEILYPQERSLGLCPMNTMLEFHDFINYSALVDLPLRGDDFTWSRSGGDAGCSRLDRFLVSLDWGEQFPDSLQSRLPRPLLNHFPVKLESAKLERGRFLLSLRTCGSELRGYRTLLKNGGRRRKFKALPAMWLRGNSRLLRWSSRSGARTSLGY